MSNYYSLTPNKKKNTKNSINIKSPNNNREEYSEKKNSDNKKLKKFNVNYVI